MTQIETTRFGNIKIGQEHLIHFRDGMIGFTSLKTYVLVESPGIPLVLWLQSTERPDVAFPVIEPYFFKRDYKADMNDADRFSLQYEEGDRLKLFAVLTIPEVMEQMTVNLKAPVVIDISKATASQLILQHKELEVRCPAHEAFSRALSNFAFTSNSTDAQNSDEEVWNAVDVRRPDLSI